ncbi:MAG: toxin-antitoxin system protein [Selenomonadaceae bacterium]|nr:toxin-antitoxin system protein [Selenomonadaceae bacterium]
MIAERMVADNMKTLRQKVYNMVETMSDEALNALFRYMIEYNRQATEREQRILKNREAFEDLMSLVRHAPERDYKKELEKSREERFLNACVD